MQRTITFENAFSKAFGHIGKAMDIFKSMPDPGTNGLAKPNGKAAHAVAAPAEAKERKKPGPKAKSVAATAAPKLRKKPGPKAKSEKAPKSTKSSNVAEGRRAVARGDKPKLADAVAIVMGSETMDANQVIAALKKRGWTPKTNASGLPSYISYVLSSNMKTHFDRPGRGKYTVKDPKKFAKMDTNPGKGERVASDSASNGSSEEPTDVKAAPAAPVVSTPPEASDPPKTSSPENESALADMGIGASVGANPFADDAATPA